LINKNLKTISYLTLLKIVASLLGLAYSVLQVRYFGATSLVDAYFIAMSAVYLITSLLQGGQLAEVFLPAYIKQKQDFGATQASLVLSAVINRIVLYLVVILSCLYFVAPFLIGLMGPGLDTIHQTFSIAIFRASLVLILFNIVSAFVNIALNAEQIYGRVEWTGVINSLLSILVLFLFHDSMGIWVLLIALLAGKIIEFFTGLFFLKQTDFSYRMKWKAEGFDMKYYFSILFTTSSYALATQTYNVILTAASSFLPVGSYSIFNYVLQLANKTQGIILSPISTLFFSKFSIKVAEKAANIAHFLRLPLLGLSLFAVLQLGAIILVGDDILALLWSEKALTASEYQIAYYMLIANMVGIVFSATGQIFRKATVALGGAKSLYIYWTFTQLLSAAYSFWAIKYFGVWGLASIPVLNQLLMAGVSYFVAAQKISISQMTSGFHVFVMKWFALLLAIILMPIAVRKLFLFDYELQWVGLLVHLSLFGFLVLLLAFTLFFRSFKAKFLPVFYRLLPR
jgi:putative peptidoglycan lipid II flippase